MLGPFLLFGFLLGVRHALEADHVAAVASLATRSVRLRDDVKLAGLWGLGHAGVLLGVGAILIVSDLTFPEPLVRALEGAVGLMLIALGADVLRRLRRKRVHLHAHHHGDGMLHVHAHAHEEEKAHDAGHPPHEHPHGLPSRALVVGGIHGLAGSAALALLAIQGAPSTAAALGCLLAFAVGSVLGMTIFSLAISLPMRLSAQRLGPLSHGLEGALGTATLLLGCWIVVTALLGAP